MEILKFYGTWCAPCKVLSPIVDEVAEEVGVKVTGVNVEEDQQMLDKYGITAVPTLVFLKAGEETDRLHGVVTKKDIVKCLS